MELYISSASGSVRLDNLFAKPLLIYRIILIIGYPAYISFIKQIDVCAIYRHRGGTTRKTVTYDRLPSRPGVGLYVFCKYNGAIPCCLPGYPCIKT